MSELVSAINSSEKANATAYWDNIDGKLVIKSRTTGASLINIEAGSSNFEKYRERLEAKFSAMDLLIANMQNQYSSFLG